MEMTDMKFVQNIYVAGMLIAVMCTACSSESTTSDVPTTYTKPNIVIFQADMRGSMTRSRQTIEYSRWTEGDQIAVSDATANSPLKYKAATSSMENSGGVSFVSFDEGNIIYWPADKRDMHYDAWYPYATSRPVSAEVPANQQDVETMDLLYAPGESHSFVQGSGNEPDPQTVPLTFYHQMARLVINIHIMTDDTWGSVTIGDGTNIGRIRAITHLGVTGETATETTKTQWGTLSEKTTITPKQLSANNTNKTYCYECLLPPQQGTNTNDLMTIITKMANNNDRPYHYKTAYDFQAGYQYTYTFELSIQGITMTTSVMPWTDETPVNVNDPLLM